MPYADVEQERDYQRNYQAEWRKRNPAKAKNIALQYRKNNPRKALLWSARFRAKKRGIPFDITLDDIVIPETCPILGIPLILNVGAGRVQKNSPNSPSLDRIRPELGYVKGNVQVISWRANDIKSDATADELERVAAFVRRQQDE